jgi:SAM-dependent methyltransferase
MDLKELEAGIDPSTHWYYQSKKLPMLSYVQEQLQKHQPLQIIDVGSGSGFFAYEIEKTFSSQINKVYLVDIGYTQEEMQATRDQKIEKVLYIPERIENSVVILMDVLEHIEDDIAMLQSIKKNCVGDNNYFFITVPAFESLWSGHDDYLGHYRRYRIASLKRALAAADFKVTNSYYLYGSLFPLVWTIRKISNLFKKGAAQSDMKPSSALINALLLKFNAAEMRIAKNNKLFGVSCVAQGKI